MNNKPISIQTFLETMERWALAVRNNDSVDAKFQADQLRAIGSLLSFDPHFKQIFNENTANCSDQDPDHVLSCLHAFMHSVTDAALSGRYRPPRGNGVSHSA